MEMSAATDTEVIEQYCNNGYQIQPVKTCLKYTPDKQCKDCGKCEVKAPFFSGKKQTAKFDIYKKLLSKHLVSQWLAKKPERKAGVGICTEGTNIVIIDCDPEAEQWRLDHLAELSRAGGISKTPRGGFHYYFKQRPGEQIKSSRSRISKGVDIIAGAGSPLYAVEYPSAGYEWLPGNELVGLSELPEVPESLINSADPVSQVSQADKVKLDLSGDPIISTLSEIPDGKRNESLISIAGQLANREYEDNSAFKVLNTINETKCKPPLSSAEMEAIFKSFIKFRQKHTDKRKQSIKYNSSVDSSFKDADQTTDTAYTSEYKVKETEDEFEDTDTGKPARVPEKLFKVGGFIEAYADYVLERQSRPQPEGAFLAALMMQATLNARKIQSKKLQTNLFCVLLGITGDGKDPTKAINNETAEYISTSEELTNRAKESGMTEFEFENGKLAQKNFAYSFRGDFESLAGLEDALMTNKVQTFQVDEVDAMINGIKKGDPNSIKLSKKIREFYDRKDSYSRRALSKRIKDEDTPDIMFYPHMNFLGMGTPNAVWDAINVNMAEDGLISRILFFECNSLSIKKELPDIDPVLPDIVLDHAFKWLWWYKPGRGSIDKPILQNWKFTEPAQEMIRNFTADQENKRYEAVRSMQSGRANKIFDIAYYSRSDATARKFSLNFAASLDPNKNRIDINEVDQAINLIDAMGQLYLSRTKSNFHENETHKLCNSIMRYLKSNGKTSRAKLSNGIRFTDKRDFEAAIETLEMQGKIGQEQQNSKTKPSTFYFATR